MKNIKSFKTLLVVGSIAFLASCTDLDEKIIDGVPVDSNTTIVTADALKTTYASMSNFQTNDFLFLNELSTDSQVRPTRGSDGDDNAKWRQLHTHTWDATHATVASVWNNILSIVYNCNLVIDNATVASEIDQARFLRALSYYYIVDLFGQVPYREKGSPTTADAKVWTRAEATAFIISELEDVASKLPPRIASKAYIANADAAYFILAKIYLNKAVFTAENPAGPYTFDPEDMNKVVFYIDKITTSGLEADYWKNFAPNNDTSNEILFSYQNIRGIKSTGSTLRGYWSTPSHYYSLPGVNGSNGTTAAGEYYDRFFDPGKDVNDITQTNDIRISTDKNNTYVNGVRTTDYLNLIKNLGNSSGFQIGQQFAAEKRDKKNLLVAGSTTPGGTVKLVDRLGNLLVFTHQTALITSGATLETAGIRGLKYIPDFTGTGINTNPENDFVMMRYADALLMKAEAILRGATNGSIGTIMTDIAARANATPNPATLDGIEKERAKELWFESWRRNDMIRFGNFLKPNEFKPYVSDSHYILYPIPAAALFNANFKQNPGY